MSPRLAGRGAAALAVAVAVAVALAAAAATPGVAAAGAVFGLSDQSPGALSDPRVAWLGVRAARLVVPWDAFGHPREALAAALWLRAARAAHLQPLIVFDHSEQRPSELPSVARYAHQVRAFMSRYRWVRDWGAWNEENHVGEPTAGSPARAAAYYQAARSACPTCRVIAADVLDEPGMAAWLRAFRARAPGARLWGLHNYYDLNHGGDSRTRLVLSLVPGELWFTETGGSVWRYDRPSRHFILRGEGFAARAASRVLALARLSPRITRIYYYQWRVPVTLAAARRHPGRVTWDSGLVRPDCRSRPALTVIARALGHDPARAPRALLARDGSGCVAAGHAAGPAVRSTRG